MLSKQLKIFGFILLVSLLVFNASLGIGALFPTNINWLMTVHHDWGTHYLGWAFYRNDPWMFPLGATKSYDYPVGANVGLTDSIPLLALTFKLLNPILTETFQYFGFWIFSCVFLNGYYGFKILNLFSKNLVINLLLSVFFIICPLLLYRYMHPALCAQWLLLASFYNYFLVEKGVDKKRVFVKQLIIVALSAAIHPYLTAMVFSLFLVIIFRMVLLKKVPFIQFVSFVMVTSLVTFAIWFLIGIVDLSSDSYGSSGDYTLTSMNLNSPFNGNGYAKFFGELKMQNPMQYDGFAYLGCGFLALIVFSLFYFLRNYSQTARLIKRHYFLLIFLVGFVVFAITKNVTLGESIVLSYPTPNFVDVLGGFFRAPARFLWPTYYFILITTCVVVSKLKLKWQVVSLMSLLLLTLQIYDIQNLFNSKNLTHEKWDYTTPLQDKKWRAVFKHFDAVLVYPLYSFNYSMTYQNDYQDLSFLALKEGKPISNAYLARVKMAPRAAAVSELKFNLKKGKLDSKILFVTIEKELKAFENLIANNTATIRKIDNFFLVFNSEKTDAVDKILKLSSQEIENTNQVKNQFKGTSTKVEELNGRNFSAIGEVKFNVDFFEQQNRFINIRGWALYLEGQKCSADTLFFVLQSTTKRRVFKIQPKSESRPDVAVFYKEPAITACGFNDVIDLTSLPADIYSLNILFSKNDVINAYYPEIKEVILKD